MSTNWNSEIEPEDPRAGARAVGYLLLMAFLSVLVGLLVLAQRWPA